MTDQSSSVTEAYALLEQAISECGSRADALRARVDEALDVNPRNEERYRELQEQLAGVEVELCEEKERAENLNELANERREEITRITEKFEEAQERYEEAKWLLGKSSHFEKLVKRRKKLIGNLIRTIRAKQKANTALKAGMDGLRNYKATVEGKRQELLGRIEKLENSLKEAEERALKADGDQRRDMPTANLSQISDLKNQIAAHENTIKGLREELRHARVVESENAVKSREIERLNENLTSKNAVIESLRRSADEQERMAAHAQELEAQVQQLQSTAEVDQQMIQSLEKQVAELRVSLAEHVTEQPREAAADAGALSERVKEQEASILRMANTLKEYEGTIATLSEAVDHWKRKYDFVTADTPYNFDSASQ